MTVVNVEDKIKITDGKDTLNIDGTKKGAVTITTEHDMVHDGVMYHTDHVYDEVADTASVAMMFVTRENEPHMKMGIGSEAKARYLFYEDCTCATVNLGTIVSIENFNRTKNKITVASAFWKGTQMNAASMGTELHHGTIYGSTSKQQNIGGGVRDGVEWILKKNTQYCVKVVNLGGEAKDVGIHFEYYE